MQPYKRKRRTGGSMVVLGGWLFADLLLGLAMLFAVATTVGAPPPTPTPTATPDELATAEANFARSQVQNQQTVSALEDQIAQADLSARQTEEARQLSQQQADARATREAQAEATRAALSESERATADAQSTQDAVVAQATIAALSTQQAQANSDAGSLNDQLATQQAIATQNAASGVDNQGTIDALQNQIAANDSAVATSQAQSSSAQATVEALQQQQANANATADALSQQVAANSLNRSAVEESIQVDLNGVLSNDSSAISDAKSELDKVLGKYENGGNCQIGFALISSRADELGQGVDLSDAIAKMIQDNHQDILPKDASGGPGQLISESIALPGTTPVGEVQLKLFFNTGCQPAG
ncbi:MAG: hypothetical protein WBA63_02740 [Thermomicrobiales bacterium]